MSQVTAAVKRWLESIVIALDLCPFAKRELLSNRIRFKESIARSQEQLLQDLVIELALLKKHPEVETTLLIHPEVLQDFDEYNQFLDFVDELLQQMNFAGDFQIASFHPNYRFADTKADDVENFTNRSPYPILHILREASLEEAIVRHADTQQIPQRNIRLMRELGSQYMTQLLAACDNQQPAKS